MKTINYEREIKVEKFDLETAQRLFDLASRPSHLVLDGVKGALHLLEREDRKPEVVVAEKLSNFCQFLDSDDGEYQEDFKIARKSGQLIFARFSENVLEQHGIEIVEPVGDLANIDMPNNHWLEIHRQNSGDLFLLGSVKNPN